MGRATQAAIRSSLKPVDSWWTVLVIDPVAARVLPVLLRFDAVTPNALTLVAALAGLSSGVMLLAGVPVLAGALFELRFFLDCLDGKVARIKRSGSAVGMFLDSAADLVVGTFVFAAAGLWSGGHGPLPARLCLLPAALAAVWSWSNLHAVSSERRAAGDQGRSGRGEPSGRLAAFLRRHRLTRLPSSVEATTAALFLAPLTGSATVVSWALVVVSVGFYVPATAHNLAKSLRAARRVDAQDAAAPMSSDAVPPAATVALHS
jgi:phosphatidylglycerophosphate synthase